MLGIELQLVSDGHRVSLDDFAELVASKVAHRIAQNLDRRLALPQPHQKVGKPERKVVSIPEAAKLLGMGRSTIWRWIQEKRVETVRLGPRTTRIRMETTERILRDGISGPVR